MFSWNLKLASMCWFSVCILYISTCWNSYRLWCPSAFKELRKLRYCQYYTTEMWTVVPETVIENQGFLTDSEITCVCVRVLRKAVSLPIEQKLPLICWPVLLQGWWSAALGGWGSLGSPDNVLHFIFFSKCNTKKNYLHLNVWLPCRYFLHGAMLVPKKRWLVLYQVAPLKLCCVPLNP